MPRVKKKYGDKSLALLVKNVGQMLKHCREEMDLSQNQLGKKSGVSISTINEIENQNVNDIRLSTICTLAKYLKVDPLLLLTPTNMKMREDDIKEFKKVCRVLNKINTRLV